MAERRIRAYEIVNHGVDHAQYFQGCGTSFTPFTDVATGCGETARDAYEDALDSLAQHGWNVATLPTRPRGIRQSDSVAAHIRAHGEDPYDRGDDCELYVYVSIRVR